MKTVLVTCIAVLTLAAPAASQKVVSASKGWIKAPAAGETSAVAFAVIDNPTMYDVYLVSATSEVAGGIRFQKPPKPGDKPEPTDAVSAPAYDALELKADGVHMLLTGLKRPLKPGETVVIQIVTDGGAGIDVAAEVRK